MDRTPNVKALEGELSFDGNTVTLDGAYLSEELMEAFGSTLGERVDVGRVVISITPLGARRPEDLAA